jgi:hypothetical protein
VEGGKHAPVLVDLAAAADEQVGLAVVDVVGLLVGEQQAGGVPAFQPGESRDAVLEGRDLAPLRIVDVRQRLVALAVEVARSTPARTPTPLVLP